ncbi:exopolysaccharide biosynthesis protein [Stenomitos frigidus]|uniref:Exopolysaccharide biosynthesis protein n=1 Tax=Stenomitos frigidus ULC18 TaxID=2107698 RepID=A0A2T1E1F6_9CYAN|nr:exopolysaccharide biosynthesis protein [Stenomitos frigidus]PSB26572.1 exopolysaccharide biosynthesis protein [Stenomitos frigidus ULC18]
MKLRFSQDLEALLTHLAEKPLTLGDILAETSERGFSLVIGLMALPFLLPMPPGFAGPLGFGCLILAAQMAIGRRSPWLPKRIAQFQFPNWLVLNLLNLLRRVTGLLEKLARPRLRQIAESHSIWRLNGVCIAWLAFLLMLPIPFTNPIPTAGILLLAVATLEADGLLMCIAYGLTIAITLAVAGIGYTLWQSPSFFQDLFG